jgi:hypothetical protein
MTEWIKCYRLSRQHERMKHYLVIKTMKPILPVIKVIWQNESNVTDYQGNMKGYFL